MKALLWPWTRVPWAKEGRRKRGTGGHLSGSQRGTIPVRHFTVLLREAEGEKERKGYIYNTVQSFPDCIKYNLSTWPNGLMLAPLP